MTTFREDLARATAYHGHLCSGQILGVRMARMALRFLQIDEPLTCRDLILFVETDRCIADAAGTVTGCKIGRRRLKWMDYGKTAIALLDIGTGKAVRIHRKERIFAPDGAEGEAMIAFYETIPDETLFTATEVAISLRAVDLPGKPLDVAVCEICKEEVLDGRQIVVDGHVFCKGCHDGHYYQMGENNVGTV
ncbi:MAG: FmdE family protein [Ruthenibacterium sp.]